MKYLIVLLALIPIFTSCEKIIAEDITGEVPVLILPTNGAQVTINPVHFKWEEMEGASKYHLMVVSPSFANPQSYVLDTLITGTEFFYSLDSNFYELKLVGVNGGYRSDTLGPIAFEVSAAGGGGGGTLVLTNPSNGNFVNASFGGNFNWTPLQNVDNYEFALREGTDFSIGNPLETQPGISTTNHTYTPALSEGEYVWRITANFTSGTSTFTTNSFSVDTTTPNQATLSLPLDASTQFSGTVDFTWSNGTDPGNINAPVISYLQFADDVAFSNPDEYLVSGNMESLDFTAFGTYYWRVINIDAAGNEANSSAIYSFIIQ